MDPKTAEELIKNKKFTKAEIERVRKAVRVARFVPGTNKLLTPAVRAEIEKLLKEKESEL